MDSSLKIPIRFGETIKAYKNTGKDLSGLKLIPLVFAGWLRYLLGIDDQGRSFEVSPDPNYESLAAGLSGISLGQTSPFHSKLEPILANSSFFGVNLYESQLGERVEKLFSDMLAGPGAVRNTLRTALEYT
jgi:fructuronate reductase